MRGCVHVGPADPAALKVLAGPLAALPLLQAYGQTATNLEAALLRALAEGDGLLVATTTQNGPVGLAWFTPRGGLGLAAYLRLLAVVPEARSLGAGRALLHAFESDSQHARGGQLVLCNAKNAPALGFYRANGYAQVGVLRRFVRPEHDELLLHRPPLAPEPKLHPQG